MTLAGTWTAEHFFIETTMTVGGLIAVLNWDSAFPDRRDVLVLAPLPVRTSTLLLAKISALFAAPSMAMLALNLLSGVAWPLNFYLWQGRIIGGVEGVAGVLDHDRGCGGFFVFTVLAVQGLAANLLPRQYVSTFVGVSAGGRAVCLLLSVVSS